MASDRGSWLEGPGSARPLGPDFYPGKRLGLPETGSGAVAGIGSRIGAYFIDAAIAGLIAGIFVGASRDSDNLRGVIGVVIFMVMTIVLLSSGGQTIGMRLLKIKVVHVPPLRMPWVIAIVLRTLILGLVIPAAIFDRDRRGLHDRAAGAVVVRA